MKDSSVEWIGEIPDDWDVHKIKSYYSIVNGSTPKSDKSEYWGGDIIWITPAEMSPSIVEIYDSKRTITEDGLQSCGTTLLPINSIILSTRAPIGQVCIAGTNLCTNQGCKSLVMRKEFNYKYSYYYLSSQTVTLNMLGRGTTFMELSSYDLANYPLPIPPLPTQNRIASFLDTKCSLIDAAVQKEREIIDKLKEYRQAVITEAVTKGIRPGVPMKDSGVEWIGEIPEGWDVCKIKYHFEIIKRLYYNEDRDVLSVTQHGLKIKDIQSNKGQLAQTYAGYQLVHINDFVMNHMDLLTGSADCSKFEGVTSPDYRVFRLRDKTQGREYYKYLFQMYYKNRIFYGQGQGVSFLGRWRLQTEVFKNMGIIVPPLLEQQEIADYIDKKCSAIDATIQKRELAIEKLTQYKQSLIYECVTGKREVLG